MDEKKYALITGATGGLGKAFVEALAERGYALLLTGRSEEKLLALQTETKEKFPDIETRIYPADLSNEGGRYALNDNFSIVFGGFGRFFLGELPCFKKRVWLDKGRKKW